MHNILFRYLCSSTCFGHTCAHPQEDLCIFTISGSMSVSFGDRAGFEWPVRSMVNCKSVAHTFFVPCRWLLGLSLLWILQIAVFITRPHALLQHEREVVDHFVAPATHIWIHQLTVIIGYWKQNASEFHSCL